MSSDLQRADPPVAQNTQGGSRPPPLSSLLRMAESEAEFIERHVAESRGVPPQLPAQGFFNIEFRQS